MKRVLIILILAVLVPLTVTAIPVLAQSEPGYYQISDQDGYADDDLLYPEELDDLLGRIALYPDPLIAQILPAATYVDQIHDAANFVRLYGNTPRIDYQPWDISVRAVAHYPQVLYMMDREYQWTASLGQAYIEQPQDVMDAIQRLRRFAYEQGNLFTTREQQVYFEGDVIRIVPGRPEFVYVPVYDPTVVYVERYYPSSPFITFSVGFAIGPWLNRDFNWREHRVYYHGWRGDGWITRSRPYARDRRGIYINRRASTITINERVVQRDTRNYRAQLRVETRRHREEGKMPPVRLEPRRPGKVEPVRPGIPQQQRGRVEQPRPGKVEQQRPANERRREPWNRRETAPAPGVPAPAAAPAKPGTPPPATRQQPAPAPPRGETVQPPGAPVKPQPQPGRQRTPAPPKQQPQVQTGTEQTPAVTGEPPAGRPGKGEGRRREPRPVNRPGVQPPEGAKAPAPAPSAPAARGAVPHAPAAEPAVKAPAAAPAVRATPAAPAAPARPVTPRVEHPRVAPAPAPATPPAPNADPAEPARPVRDFEPGQGRGRGESTGGRAIQRGQDR
ncbi:DUF3300 domain-containing protein [Geomonas subterranea]|uniref:DUF3300 domain-containing protein n=1 Tax=Geomonas subterranea TaxID=2847989 RepID=A0ABX8LQW7_9BACT|nr:DUF3300 domain-containing protein [Geomonas subterranea]QXE91920.1 DUF3300 domain-containing protein [Geomonas subterranea]QXM09988.1 DUF3300 domain-containing protein [Geomonas subterranea]